MADKKDEQDLIKIENERKRLEEFRNKELARTKRIEEEIIKRREREKRDE